MLGCGELIAGGSAGAPLSRPTGSERRLPARRWGGEPATATATATEAARGIGFYYLRSSIG